MCLSYADSTMDRQEALLVGAVARSGRGDYMGKIYSGRVPKFTEWLTTVTYPAQDTAALVVHRADVADNGDDAYQLVLSFIDAELAARAARAGDTPHLLRVAA